MDFLPHRVCYRFNELLALIIGSSDFTIGAAYWLIAWGLFAIALMLREAEAWPVIFQQIRIWMAWCFGGFILFCGLGHWVDVITLYRGWYWLTAAVRIATAILSMGTAIACWRVMNAIKKELKWPRTFQWRKNQNK